MSISCIQLDDLNKAKIVYMVLNKRTEEALEYLSNHYNIVTPKIVVGTVKGKRKTVYAVYVQKQSKIYALTFYRMECIEKRSISKREVYHS